MRAAFYGRYSTDMQSEDSIEDQYRNCDRYAEREGWDLIERYKDEAISGTVKDRPDYQRMLADAKAGHFKVLLLDDLSRLSRDSVETQQTLKRLKYWGVRVIAVSDGFDSDSKSHKIQAGFKGMMNELFLDDLAAKTHRGLEGKALNGYNCGGRTYGYRHIKILDPIKKDAYGDPLRMGAKREIDSEQAKWVVQIFEWYAIGFSPRWIAAKLNELKVPAPRAQGTWTLSTIYGDMKHGTGLLNNPLYIGKYIWNRSKWTKDPDTGAVRRIERPESEWVTNDQPELQIVTSELWDRVKSRQKSQCEKSVAIRQALHGKARTGSAPKFLFSGLLKCGCCGGNFVMINQTQYGCSVRKDRGETVCNNTIKVSRKVVEDRLLEGVKTELFTPEALELFIKETQRLLTEHQRKKTGAKDGQRKRLELVEKEISNIMAAIKAGILTPSTKSELERAEAEKRDIERALTHNSGGGKVVSFLPRAEDIYKRLINDLGKSLQTDVVRARTQLRMLLGDEIRLIPQEGYLEAEIRGDYAGLLSIVAPKINVAGGPGFEPR